ncbi:MAG: SpoIIE family protein phosphatase [Desulfovibrionaceae bacterium]
MRKFDHLTREELLRELRVATTELESFKFACRGDALRLAESIIEMSPAVLFRRMADETGKLVFVSRNVSQWGYSAAELLCEELTYADMVHPDDREDVETDIRLQRERDAEVYEQAYRIRTAGGETRWVHDRTSVVRDEDGRPMFNQGLVIDITERVLAEEELRRSEEKFRRIIQTAAEGFVLMDDELRFLDMNDAILRMLGYEREDLLGRTSLEFTSPGKRRFLISHRDELLSRNQRVFESEMIAKDGTRIPVIVHGNTLTDTLGAFLGNVAFVTNISEQKKALRLAEEVQRGLQPSRPPELPGLDVAGRSDPSSEVGGDYFDYIQRAPEQGAPAHLCVAVGDVSGHGVDAALLMTAARAFLRMRSMQPGGPVDMVADLNRHLAADLYGSGRFLTLVLLCVGSGGADLSWVLAGHDPPLLFDPGSDSFTPLRGRDLPVGVVPGYVFTEHTAPPLAPGQMIVLGTDGIWEARSPSGEMFGKARFRQVVRRAASGSAQEVLDAVYAALGSFTDGAQVTDDITLVVLKKH